MKKSLIIAALGAVLAGVGVNASAVTNTSSSDLGITVTLTNVCTVLTTNAGATFTKPALATGGVVTVASLGTVSVGDCAATYKVGAGQGNSYSGSRRLREAATAHYIPYTLGLSVPVPGTGTPTTDNLPISAASSDWGSLDLTGFTNPTTVGNSGHVAASAATVASPDVFTISAQFNIPNSTSAPASTTAYTDSVTIGVEF